MHNGLYGKDFSIMPFFVLSTFVGLVGKSMYIRIVLYRL
jgi:hypothetical protein